MTDPTPAPPTAPAPRRRLRWLLVASLALNLLFAGLLAGGALRLWRDPPGSLPPVASAPMLLWQALPDEDRRALREQRHPGDPAAGWRDRHRAMRAEVQAEVATLRALLTAEPYDPAPLAVRLAEARDRQSERGERAAARMLERIAAMSPAERTRLADRMERRALRRSERD